MNSTDIIHHKDVHKYVCDIANNPLFLRLKDAFLAHSPGGEDKSREDAVAVAHGKLLGTRFVFNEIERLARTPPPNKPKYQTGPDADLAT